MNFHILDTYFYNRKYTQNEIRYIKQNRNGILEGDSSIKPILFPHSIKMGDIENFTTDSDYESDRESGSGNKFSRRKIRNYYLTNDKTTKRRFIATMFGKTIDDENIAIHVLDYQPYFWIRIPTYFRKNLQRFKKNFIHLIFKSLGWKKNKHSNIKKLISQFNIEHKIQYQGFTNNKKKPYYKISFRNSNTYIAWKYACQNIYWSKTLKQFRIFKDKNKKHLSFRRLKIFGTYTNYKVRFFNDIKLNACGWNQVINFRNMPQNQKLTYCKYEIYCMYNPENIKKNSDLSHIPKITKLSFDIECAPLRSIKSQISKKIKELKDTTFLEKSEILSEIKNTTFHPILNLGDPVVQVGMSFLESKMCEVKSGSVRNYIISLSHPDITKKGERKINNKKDKFNSFTFIPCNSERELILKFAEIFTSHSPDIVIQYNGNGYDWEYLYKRAMYLGILEDFSRLSKFIRAKCRWVCDKKKDDYYKNSYMYIPGCLNIDILRYYKSLNDSKYPNLKLNTIAEHDTGHKKEDLKYGDLYKLISEALRKPETLKNLIIVGNYCIQDCTLLHKIMEKRQIITHLYAGSRINTMSPSSFHVMGPSRKVLSIVAQLCDECGKIVRDEMISDREMDEIYRLALKNDENVKRSFHNISASRKDLLESKIKSHKKEFFKNYGARGAKVFDPKPGLYLGVDVGTMDIKSMYPSITIRHNISHDTIVMKDKYLGIKGYVYKKLQWSRKNNQLVDVIIADYVGRRDPENPKLGILPKAMMHCLNERGIIRKKQKELVKRNITKGINEKTTSKSIEYLDLDANQLQVKILNNSIYGINLSRFNPLYSNRVGGLITYQSYIYISKCASLVKDKYGADVIYGDTDSIFIKFPINDIKADIKSIKKDHGSMLPNSERIKISLRLANERERLQQTKTKLESAVEAANTQDDEVYHQVVKQESEKIYKWLFLGSVKKHYIGMVWYAPKFKYDEVYQNIMGMTFKKRNASKLTKHTGQSIYNLINQKKINQIIPFFEKLIDDVYDGKFSYNYFLKGEKYNPPADPKTSRTERCVILIRKFLPGVAVSGGDRIFYTILWKPPKRGKRGGIYPLKIVEKVYPVLLIENTNANVKIDYKSFLTYAYKSCRSIFLTLFNGSEYVANEWFDGIIKKKEEIYEFI
jgi:DNA polymerase elongation subunit (family B)